MSVRLKLAALAVSVMATIGVAAAVTPAQAQTGNQWCYQNGQFACINAWGGGPRVNVSTVRGLSNNDFEIINDLATGASLLEDTGNNAGNGKCVGDFGNATGTASAGLVSCGNGGEGAGFGTNMDPGTSGCPAGQEWLFDRHWQGWVGPPNGWTNGSFMFLNKTVKICFVVSPPA